MESKNITVVVLTFNSENSIGHLIDAVKPFAETIWVVDSFSTDTTESIVKSRSCRFVQNEFDNYAAQRRWAESHIGVPEGRWILHLDSDEIPDRDLADALRKAAHADDPAIDGYLVRRLTYFWGRPIRHGHMNPSWHLRLYRSGKGKCEDRLYDQHYICTGPTRRLPGRLLDLQLADLSGWTASHNRWSSAEARETLQVAATGDRLAPRLNGDQREKKRWVKEKIWYRLPLFVRPSMLFFYNYVLKGGFLDGKTGLVYHVLHAFWFRFLVDAKILEMKAFGDAHPTQVTKEWLAGQGVNLD